MLQTLTNHEVQKLNQLIDEVLQSEGIDEVHIFDIAWLLQVDPIEADQWMHQHCFGKWMTESNPSYWRAI